MKHFGSRSAVFSRTVTKKMLGGASYSSLVNLCALEEFLPHVSSQPIVKVAARVTFSCFDVLILFV
jgi:hypothetical protein